MIAVGVGTAVGLNALLSRKIGQHKTEEACQAATTGLFLMLVISLLFSVTGILFSDTIAARLTPDPDLQNLCEQYLSVNLVYCWGIFLQTMGSVCAGSRRYGSVYDISDYRSCVKYYPRPNHDIWSVGLPRYGNPGSRNRNCHRTADRCRSSASF